MKYRKKPVAIEAVQYTGDNFFEVRRVMLGNGHPLAQDPFSKSFNDTIQIHTLEGTMYAMPGDWVIRGIKGEFYPCKPDIFEATYERVDD